MTTKTQHWTSLGYFRPLFDYTAQQGFDCSGMLALLGLQESDLKNSDLRIAHEHIAPLFKLARATTNDDNVGLHAGQEMKIQHVGILGLLALTCSRAKEAFDLHTRYQSLVGNGLDTRFHVEGGLTCMELSIPPGLPHPSRQEYEYHLGGWFQLKDQVVGAEHKACRVELPYGRPANDDEQTALFGVSPSYGHDVARIYFDSTYNELDLTTPDPQLKQILELQARKRLQELQGEQADTDPQLAEVKQLIANKLAWGAPSLEEIAEEMQVSRRTLQRQLDKRESSFKDLLDQVRKDLACKYIETPDLALLDVAFMLGFSEQSSFARAFKRWFGEAPGVYRRSLTPDS